MGKQGEIGYFRAIGEAGQRHAAGRPFTDLCCGLYLARIGQAMELLPPPPARILDMGCGTGWTSAFLARRGYDVVGVDIAPDMIEAAKLAHPPAGLNLEFAVADYESMSYTEEFDGVLFFDSLHHAEDEGEALRCAFQALRRGGVCVTSEPGIGHHETAESQRAIEDFGVNEKEMPPWKITRLGRLAGFREMRTYAHQGQIFSLLNLPPSPERKGLIGLVARTRPLRPVLAFLLMAFLKRWSGVVVLTR